MDMVIGFVVTVQSTVGQLVVDACFTSKSFLDYCCCKSIAQCITSVCSN